MKKQERANRQALGSMICQLGITIQTHSTLSLRRGELFEGLTEDEKKLIDKYKSHLHGDGNKLIALGNRVRDEGK